MTDPEQVAQAKALAERLEGYAYKATMLALFEREGGQRNALLKSGQAFKDAAEAIHALTAAHTDGHRQGRQEGLREATREAFEAGFQWCANGTDRHGEYVGGSLEYGFADFRQRAEASAAPQEAE